MTESDGACMALAAAAVALVFFVSGVCYVRLTRRKA